MSSLSLPLASSRVPAPDRGPPGFASADCLRPRRRRFGPGDFTGRASKLLGIDPALVFLKRELGCLPARPCVLEGRFRTQGRDPLGGQLRLEGRRVEFANQIPFLTRVPSGTMEMIVVWPSTSP